MSTNTKPNQPAPLPSRERAGELAHYETDLRDNFARSAKSLNITRDHAHARAADTAAILSAYASGRLVPVERVEGMRERAAAVVEELAAFCEKSAAKPEYSERVSEKFMAAASSVTQAAFCIRALPLDGTEGGGADHIADVGKMVATAKAMVR